MSDAVFVASLVVVGWVVSVCFHEFAHAFVAYIGGDTSVKRKGYLNFNPFAYTDIRLSVILPTMFIMLGGIGLPGASVQIREDQLRNRYWMSLVSAAGPFATFLFALGLVGIISSGNLPDLTMLASCWLLNIEVVVLILNLLPVPGLDGFGIIEPFISRNLKAQLRPFYKYGIMVIIALMWLVPGPNRLLWETSELIMNWAGIPSVFVMKGESLYRDGAPPVAGCVIAIAVLIYYVRKRTDWNSQADKFLKAEQFTECLALLQQVLSKSDDARAHKLSALCYAGLASKTAQAEAAAEYKKKAYDSIEKCIALEPKACENYLAKGIVCETVKDADAALEAYSKSLEINKEFGYAFARYCNIYWERKKFSELLLLCDKRLGELPDDGEALFQKGAALAALGRYNEALPLFEKCIKFGVRRELSQKNKEIVLAQLAKSKKE